MEAAFSSETLLSVYQTTRCHLPDDSNFHNNENSDCIKRRKFLMYICDYQRPNNDTAPFIISRLSSYPLKIGMIPCIMSDVIQLLQTAYRRNVRLTKMEHKSIGM